MKVIRPIVSVLLAVLVLFSSTSFAVDVHFCAGAVKDIAVFTAADGCRHSVLPPCHRKQMADCCDDVEILHDGEEFNSTSIDLTAHTPVAVCAEVPPVVVSIVVPSSGAHSFPTLLPDIPIPARDITVEHRTFLI